MRIQHRAIDRRSRANALRDQKIEAGFDWCGVKFQADAASRQAIAARSLRAQRTGLPVEWRASDNSSFSFSADEFIAFADAIDSFAESLMVESWQLKQNA
ncbi:DUF4376 domain-containing protein [Stutzerimonas stutzeri]